ncbi:MAG: hypothetical protein ACREK9_14245, partial [Candidatus Rokuibacteriota bacterium]
MAHSHRLMSTPWLGVILVSLLVLGHACEVPALADLATHTTESAHHSPDHHSDENLVACDAVGVPSSSVCFQMGPSLDAVGMVAAASPVPLRLATAAPPDSTRLPCRPPLFL